MGSHGRVIGLSGGIASGKSTVAKLLEAKGFFVINVDSLGHEALKSAQKEVVKTFGNEILGESGEIDRRKLGKLVFADPLLLAKLEGVLHPIMKELVYELLTQNQGRDILLDCTLLYPMGLDSLCHQVLVFETCLPIRLTRLSFKRKIPFLYALKILWNQKKLVPKNPKNVMIKNNGSLRALSRTVDHLNLS